MFQTNNTPSGEPPINEPSTSTSGVSFSNANVTPRLSTTSVQEDDVDIQLWKFDGKIQRKRDQKLLVLFTYPLLSSSWEMSPTQFFLYNIK